jgi:glutathione S-transferase
LRSAIEALGIDISMRDIREDAQALRALIEGGGKGQVPCLHIEQDDGEISWMYESSDIVNWLESTFGFRGS